jgi:1,4-dihydroxy-2-naphthoyl-CoA hydrolase
MTMTAAQTSEFLQGAGFQATSITPSSVTGFIDLGPQHHTPWGIVHGGVYATAVESAASLGASAAVADRGLIAVGLTNVTNFLRPMKAGRVDVRAVPVHQGRTQQLWNVDITDENGKLVASGQLRLQNVEQR